jgi:hypothetical protein
MAAIPYTQQLPAGFAESCFFGSAFEMGCRLVVKQKTSKIVKTLVNLLVILGLQSLAMAFDC